MNYGDTIGIIYPDNLVIVDRQAMGVVFFGEV